MCPSFPYQIHTKNRWENSTHETGGNIYDENGFLVSVGADPCVRPLTFSIYKVDLSHVPTIVSAGPKANTSRKQLFIYLDPHIQHISLKPLLPHP